MKNIIGLLLLLFSFYLSANDLILNSGKYKVAFSQKEFFSSAQYFYDGAEIGMRTGFYGTILATAPNMFVGSGHKEGGVEKLLSVKVICDGKEVKAIPATYSGDKIIFEKISLLNNLKVFVRVTLTPQEIRIDKNFEALATQKIYSLYIFQFCWTHKSDKWIIGRPDETIATGNFKSNEGWFLRGKEPELLWYALYDTKQNVGVLGYFSEYFPKQGSYMLWDRPVYHKFYFNANLPKVVSKGYKSKNYSMVLKGFKSTPKDWQKTIESEAKKLLKRFPLPEAPKEINFDETFSIKGNGKFNCKKLSIPVAKNSQYSIEFKIKKSPDVSEKIYQNYILIGQYDKARKFKVYASFADKTPKDNKFHYEKGTFKTPEKIYDMNIYIYNINSKGLVEVKDLKIKKLN